MLLAALPPFPEITVTGAGAGTDTVTGAEPGRTASGRRVLAATDTVGLTWREGGGAVCQNVVS